MEFKNHQYNEFGTIDAEVKHPEFGWIPCTFWPDDPPTATMFHAASATATPYAEAKAE